MIEMTSVTKLYGTVIGANDVNVTLPRGAHGLLGPNGAGKTTFLNLITGQLKPTRGRVRVFGQNPRGTGAIKRRIGVCPGDETLYSNVSGFDWCRYLMELHGFQSGEAADRAARALARVGMRQHMRRAIGSYSRGMRQRTKLAQAIAHDPELLILDEPFNGLDPLGRRSISELLDAWVAEGRCLILASHILHEVEAVTPSFLLICGGRLLASGTSEEVSELLADIPNAIHMRCDKPRALAQRLLESELVSGVELAADDALTVTTMHPRQIYEVLPAWVQQYGFQITELRSSAESLQSLFDSLMSAHRGGR